MIDLKVAGMRAHANNISRYRRLLRANLSDLERRSVHRAAFERRKDSHGAPSFNKIFDHSHSNARRAAFGAAVSLRATEGCFGLARDPGNPSAFRYAELTRIKRRTSA